jgi:hypothetical protein
MTGRLPKRSKDGDRLRVASSSKDNTGCDPVRWGGAFLRRFMFGEDLGLESGVAKGEGRGVWVGV